MNKLLIRIPIWATDAEERFAIRTSTRDALLAAAPYADVPAVPTAQYNTMASWSRLGKNNKNILPSSLWQIHEVLALSPSRSSLSTDATNNFLPPRPSPNQLLDHAAQEIECELDMLIPTFIDRPLSSLESSTPAPDRITVPKDSAVDLSSYAWSTIPPVTQASSSADPIESIAPEAEEQEREQEAHATKTHIFILQYPTHPSDPRTLSSHPPLSIRHLAHLPFSGGSGSGNLWRRSELFSDSKYRESNHLDIDLGDWGLPTGSARTWRSGEVHYPRVIEEQVQQQQQQNGRRTRAKSMLKESVLRLRRLSRNGSGR